MGSRKKTKVFKVEKKCRIRRTFLDYKAFIKENSDSIVVEMDSVEGSKGGKLLHTLRFVIPQLMLAFIRDANTASSVKDIIDRLYIDFRPGVFCDLFQVLLTDNGSKFSSPKDIKFDFQNNQRTYLFYCVPSAPYQKGAAENNHSLIRRVIPKRKSMDGFNQKDINLMMSHINSHGRKNLDDKSPYEIFSFLYGENLLNFMVLTFIPPNELMLPPSLLKK